MAQKSKQTDWQRRTRSTQDGASPAFEEKVKWNLIQPIEFGAPPFNAAGELTAFKDEAVFDVCKG